MNRALFPARMAAALAGTLLVASCGRGVDTYFVTSTPREAYEAQLRQVGLHTTALGRDWISAATRSVRIPRGVALPYREVRFFDPSHATALAYRVKLERGQRLYTEVDVSGADSAGLRMFLDLFLQADSVAAPQLVASADSFARVLDYVILRPGDYVLRVQPELLRGGRVTVSISAHASLGFPVAGHSVAAIRSRFGAVRDAGRREHHGLDIFAPRGTPVLASVEGQVSWVGTNQLGGNVVWLRDVRNGRNLYFAHLDRQNVLRDEWVRPGDTVGFVGNTGNARTTPPHLHFGIYLRGFGPVDPYHHLYESPERAPVFAGEPAFLGHWVRAARDNSKLRTEPHSSAPIFALLPAETPLEVLAGIGRWYLARLPDGREGFIAQTDSRALDPLRLATIEQNAEMLLTPSPTGLALLSLESGQVLPMLGRFGDYLLVQDTTGFLGWIASTAAALRPQQLTRPVRQAARAADGS